MAYILNLIVGRSVATWLPIGLPTASILEGIGLPTELRTISIVVGNLIYMANFLRAALGSPLRCPLSSPVFPYVIISPQQKTSNCAFMLETEIWI